jgi:trehalose synthase
MRHQALTEVSVAPLSLERFAGVVDPHQWAQLESAADAARELLAGRVVWNVNSTATGGGVAELLEMMLAYARGARVDARWLVMRGDPAFFTITKRVHNWLHNSAGDGAPLTDSERHHYLEVSRSNAEALCHLVSARDVVLLHDPQTAGLVAQLHERGATVVWRCHVGADVYREHVVAAWDFLRPHLAMADAYVFSRRAFVPPWLDEGAPVTIIPPSIDPFSAKNQGLRAETVHSILATSGLIDGKPQAPATFTRRDGVETAVRQKVRVVRGDAPLPRDAPLVAQVSRWDRLKDMAGVMRGFAKHVLQSDAYLALVGPDVDGVADDPEGQAVLEECTAVWDSLSLEGQRRVLLVSVPMDDVEDNAAIVNALQRHATVVVQKSLAEGFGLTVAEAMWKARPVIASPVGGIQDQIVHGRHGVLLSSPTDLDGLGTAVNNLLAQPERAAQLGGQAQRRVTEQFLGDRQLIQWVQLLTRLLDR